MADRRDIQEILEEVREAGFDNLADELDEREKRYQGSSLRKANAELAARAEAAEAKAAALERAPQREQAFREYGVDVENLRPAERRELERYDGELGRDKIAAFVDELDLPLVGNLEPEAPVEAPPAQRIVGAARSAPSAQRRTGFVITPEDAEKWTADALYAWGEEHKEALNELLQGRTVTGIAPP